MRRLLAGVMVVGLMSGLFIGGATAASAETGVDGCTAVPDSGRTFDFNDACDSHDRCYLNRPHGNDAAARKQCDVDFYWDMIASCRNDWPRRSQWLQRGSCYGVAAVYYLGVRAFGGLGWDEGQSAPLAEVT